MTLRVDNYRITYGLVSICLVIAGMLFRNNAGKKELAMKEHKAKVLAVGLTIIGWLLLSSLITMRRGQNWYLPYLATLAIAGTNLVDLISGEKTDKLKKYLPLVTTAGWTYLAHLIVNSRSLRGGQQGLVYASALSAAFALLHVIPKQKSLAGPGPYILNTSLGGLVFLNSLGQ